MDFDSRLKNFSIDNHWIGAIVRCCVGMAGIAIPLTHLGGKRRNPFCMRIVNRERTLE